MRENAASNSAGGSTEREVRPALRAPRRQLECQVGGDADHRKRALLTLVGATQDRRVEVDRRLELGDRDDHVVELDRHAPEGTERHLTSHRSVEEVTMATADEVRDALFERIAYHTISADTDEVLTLAKAYSLLVEADDDDEDDDEDDDDE